MEVFDHASTRDFPLNYVKVKVKDTLRMPVYRQSVGHGARPLEINDQDFFNGNIEVIIHMQLPL
jgi:hypothetical protein